MGRRKSRSSEEMVKGEWASHLAQGTERAEPNILEPLGLVYGM